jgi:hypothetical protein
MALPWQILDVDVAMRNPFSQSQSTIVYFYTGTCMQPFLCFILCKSKKKGKTKWIYSATQWFWNPFTLVLYISDLREESFEY